jgi:glycosyltransferase 2 family protein
MGDRVVPRAWWLRLVGPAIAIALLARLDLHEIGETVAGVRWGPFVCSLALVAPLFGVKAWRWQLLLSRYGRDVPLREAFELYTISAGAGALTPGAVGDFWKSFSPAVAERSIGFWTSMLDRLYDIAFLVMLGAAVATSWIASSEVRVEALSALLAAFLAVWFARGRIVGLVKLLLPGISPEGSANDGHEIGATAATLVASAIAIVRFALLVQALALPLRWPQVLVAFTLTSGVATLPLSVAGIGTRDVILVGYLGSYGIPAAAAIALSSLCLALVLWNGVLAAVLWLLRPPPQRRHRASPEHEKIPAPRDPR